MPQPACPECDRPLSSPTASCPYCDHDTDQGTKILELQSALALITLILSIVMTISWHQDGGALWGLGIAAGGVWLVVVKVMLWRRRS